MKAKISLRLGSRYYAVKERRSELLALLKEYRDTITEVAFFTGPGFFPARFVRSCVVSRRRFAQMAVSFAITFM